MSDFLFARPSFLGGASRVLDLFGTLQEYNKPPTPQLADHQAMFDDFRAIGTDLEQMMKAMNRSGCVQHTYTSAAPISKQHASRTKRTREFG